MSETEFDSVFEVILSPGGLVGNVSIAEVTVLIQSSFQTTPDAQVSATFDATTISFA